MPKLALYRRYLAGIVTIVFLACQPMRAWSDAGFPPPEPPEHPETLGAGIGRTMHLLRASTAEHRNKVRILFYGQSITEQEWWHQVADNLRQRFPLADLEIINRAIGGFASDRLIRPAEHDIFPFYPDLIIFHVYGDHRQYESIIRSIRSRTTAEVLMQTDHITKWPPEKISKSGDKAAWWDDQMNHKILPGIAAKYGCGLVDIHTDWLRYLKTNHLEPSALLLDDVHLNPDGCNLMARLVERYLVEPSPIAEPPSDWADLVKTEVMGRQLEWVDGRLSTHFEGNRVDLVASRLGDSSRSLSVRVDGKKPSEIPELYAITRPEPKPWSALALVRVNHDQPLLVEEWTLTIDSYRGDPASWTFHVVGSKTGPDGSGSNQAPFVSKSGRVRIEPEFWFATKPFEPGYAIHWSVQPQFVDVYTPNPTTEPGVERTTTLLQGLKNGAHTLELIAGPGGPPTIESIRIYDPPYVPMNPVIVGFGVAFAVFLLLALTWWSLRRWVFGRYTWSRFRTTQSQQV